MANQEKNVIMQALMIMQVHPQTSVRNLAAQLNVSRYFIGNVQDRLNALKLTVEQAVALPDDAFDEAFDFSVSRKGDFLEPEWQDVWDFMNPREVKSTLKQKPMLSVAWKVLYVDKLFPDVSTLPENCMSERTFERRYHEYCGKYHKPDNSPIASLNFSRGELMEIDTIGDHFRFVQPDGTVRQVKIFTAVLKYSGLVFAEATYRTTTEMWLKCVGDAFEYLGGVPKVVRSDNDAAIVIHGKKGKSPTRPQPAYAALLHAYGAEYDLAPVRRPTYKGAVERVNGLLIQALFADKTSAVKAQDLEDYNRQLLDEVNKFNLTPRSGGQISRRSCFELYEKDCLKPLPQHRPQCRDIRSVVVGADGYVRYENNLYYAGIPGRSVELESVNGGKLEIRTGDRTLGSAKRIAVYEICHEIYPTPRRFKAQELCSAEERAVTRNKQWYNTLLETLTENHSEISHLLDSLWEAGDEDNPLAVKHSNALARLLRLAESRKGGVAALNLACGEALRQKHCSDFAFIESLFKTLMELEHSGVEIERVLAGTNPRPDDATALSAQDTDSNLRGGEYYAELCRE